jgi:hypothetical protein
MYTVLFPSGKTLVFSIRALAETYVLAYRGVLVSDLIPTTSEGLPESVCR